MYVGLPDQINTVFIVFNALIFELQILLITNVMNISVIKTRLLFLSSDTSSLALNKIAKLSALIFFLKLTERMHYHQNMCASRGSTKFPRYLIYDFIFHIFFPTPRGC